jgi:predicted metalloprotease with PDZ domain
MRIVLLVALLSSPLLAIGAQAPARVQHIVEVRDPATTVFHVTSRYTRLAQPWLDLALPVWTPGWYVIENYGKNLLRLEFTDASGKRLPWYMTNKSTWRVTTRGVTDVVVRFEYQASVLGLNQAKVTDEWAFFTGTQLFLEPVSYRQWTSSVRFVVPSGWRVLSSLRDTDDAFVFTATGYDELVDATTQLGRFDAKRFEIDGKHHWFIATPAGTLNPSQLDTMADHAARIARTQARVFEGTLPYHKYLYHYFFLPAESNASGGLEHANSHVGIVGPLGASSPTQLDGLLAHEFFHLWNVKRLRPAEMWPYDYSRENYTPSLWISEGFTNYYAGLTLLRAGLQTRDLFLGQTANAIGSIESADARRFVAIADASMATWLGYDTPQAFSISYYAGGQIVAAMLDLAIIHHSAGEARLDDALRLLWRERWAKGFGFTREHAVSAFSRAARHNLTNYVQRMVDWRQVPPYDSVFGFAGFRLERAQRDLPVLGFVGRTVAQGVAVTSVTTGSPADVAGLRVDDVVLTVDGQPWTGAGALGGQIGREVRVAFVRGNDRRTVPLRVGSRSVTQFRLVDLGTITEQQRRVRERWLGP